jgi:thiol:disulfide interchange protein DsbA
MARETAALNPWVNLHRRFAVSRRGAHPERSEWNGGSRIMSLKNHALAAALMLGAAHFLGQGTQAAPQWVEGTHYFRIAPAQPESAAEGKIEVADVFSYGCPACNQFLPVMKKLEASLPPDAELTRVPASFNPSEQWPMFQRAYYAAEVLGVAEPTHLAMFEAVWTTGELAVIDRQTRRLRNPPPTIEDVARFHARSSDVTEEQFLAAAKSFEVAMDMQGADHLIKAWRVDRTPSIVVNGKYRLHVQSAGGTEELIELVKWLVAQEGGRAIAGARSGFE